MIKEIIAPLEIDYTQLVAWELAEKSESNFSVEQPTKKLLH